MRWFWASPPPTKGPVKLQQCIQTHGLFSVESQKRWEEIHQHHKDAAPTDKGYPHASLSSCIKTTAPDPQKSCDASLQDARCCYRCAAPGQEDISLHV